MARPLICANALPVYDYLVGQGLRDFQAAGVIGNLQWESNLNPRLQAVDTDKLLHQGIAMWSPTRWQNLLTFAAGRDPWALDTQIAFLWHELQTDASLGLNALLASTDVNSATEVFQNQFENPKRGPSAHTPERKAFANDALNCLSIRPPLPAPAKSTTSKALAAAGIGAAIVGVAYAAYKVFALKPPKSKPAPAPIVPPAPPPRIRRFYPPPVAPLGARGRIP